MQLNEVLNSLYKKIKSTEKSDEEKLKFTELALRFVLCLKNKNLPLPIIEGDYNFEKSLSFEWRTKNNEFIVTLNSNGDLIYSGVENISNSSSPKTMCGVVSFSYQIPEVIEFELLRFLDNPHKGSDFDRHLIEELRDLNMATHFLVAAFEENDDAYFNEAIDKVVKWRQ